MKFKIFYFDKPYACKICGVAFNRMIFCPNFVYFIDGLCVETNERIYCKECYTKHVMDLR